MGVSSPQVEPMPPSESMDTKLATLLKYLPQLQAAGVSSLKIDGLRIDLRPTTNMDAAPQPVEEVPAGRDPVTYGFKPGTKMPTLTGAVIRRGG